MKTRANLKISCEPLRVRLVTKVLKFYFFSETFKEKLSFQSTSRGRILFTKVGTYDYVLRT